MNWIRTYDASRTPAHWTEVVRAGQYAVFLFDAEGHIARDENGELFPGDAVQIGLCDSMAAAQAFAKDVTARHEELCCEIYDHEGKAKDPLQVVYNARVRHKYEGRRYHQREVLIGSVLLAIGVSFVVHDMRQQFAWIWGYVIGLKLMTIGGFSFCRGAIGWYERRDEAG